MKKNRVEEIYNQLTYQQKELYHKEYKKFNKKMAWLFGLRIFLGTPILMCVGMGFQTERLMLYWVFLLLALQIIHLIPFTYFCIVLYNLDQQKKYNYKKMISMLGEKGWSKIKEKACNNPNNQSYDVSSTKSTQNHCLQAISNTKNEAEKTTIKTSQKIDPNAPTVAQFQACSKFINTVAEISTLLKSLQNVERHGIAVFTLEFTKNDSETLLQGIHEHNNPEEYKRKESERYKKMHSLIANFAELEVDDIFSLEMLTIPFIDFKKVDMSFILEHSTDKEKRNELFKLINNPIYLENYLENNQTNGMTDQEYFTLYITAGYEVLNESADIYTSFINNISNAFAFISLFCRYRESSFDNFLRVKNFSYKFEPKKLSKKIDTFVNALCATQDVYDIRSYNEDKPDEQYITWTTICFLIYLAKREQLKNKINEILTNNNLSFSSNLEDMINCFFKSALSQKDVFIYTVCARAFAKNDIQVVLNYENIYYTVLAMEKYKQENYLKKLESGNVKKKYTLENIDIMSGKEFERFVNEIFVSYGFETTLTPETGDQGIDIVAKKGSSTIAIQAKRYNKSVGNHAIMEAVAGMKHYDADRAIVVTNNYFTDSARTLAEENKVDLWDRKILSEKINELF